MSPITYLFFVLTLCTMDQRVMRPPDSILFEDILLEIPESVGDADDEYVESESCPSKTRMSPIWCSLIDAIIEREDIDDANYIALGEMRANLDHENLSNDQIESILEFVAYLHPLSVEDWRSEKSSSRSSSIFSSSLSISRSSTPSNSFSSTPESMIETFTAKVKKFTLRLSKPAVVVDPFPAVNFTPPDKILSLLRYLIPELVSDGKHLRALAILLRGTGYGRSLRQILFHQIPEMNNLAMKLIMITIADDDYVYESWMDDEKVADDIFLDIESRFKQDPENLDTAYYFTFAYMNLKCYCASPNSLKIITRILNSMQITKISIWNHLLLLANYYSNTFGFGPNFMHSIMNIFGKKMNLPVFLDGTAALNFLSRHDFLSFWHDINRDDVRQCLHWRSRNRKMIEALEEELWRRYNVFGGRVHDFDEQMDSMDLKATADYLINRWISMQELEVDPVCREVCDEKIDHVFYSPKFDPRMKIKIFERVSHNANDDDFNCSSDSD